MISFLLSLSLAVSLDDNAFSELLRNRLEGAPAPELVVMGEERILASRTLPAFYAERFYRPVWIRDGEITRAATDLVRALRGVDGDGLDPADYHLGRIEAGLMRASSSGARALVDLELLLTDAFLLLGTHLLEGSVDPVGLDPEWDVAPSRRRDLMVLLANVTLTGRVTPALDELRPKASEYRLLKRALVDYRKLAADGGWPEVPDGPKLEAGTTDERMRALRARLRITGELGDGAREREPELFDDDLADAVRRFQRRHGLSDDGVVGARTLEAMNVTARERVRQIELSLERWRWLAEDLGRRHIRVNIPAFGLDVFEDERAVLEMRVVVGQPYRRTPVFSGKMTYLVLSPYWHVPPSLAVQDVLPSIRKDPGYLSAKKIRVFEGWGADTREIDPASVDWSAVSARSFPYRFRQEPGPLNALGRVKFMFPNEHNVYLHDTPSRELFARADRSFSSGCIRLERPLALASLLLGPDWPEERVREEAARSEDRTVLLPEPVDVHILYLTSWVDPEGAVQFRRDVYGRDVLLDEALRARPPRWVTDGE